MPFPSWLLLAARMAGLDIAAAAIESGTDFAAQSAGKLLTGQPKIKLHDVNKIWEPMLRANGPDEGGAYSLAEYDEMISEVSKHKAELESPKGKAGFEHVLGSDLGLQQLWLQAKYAGDPANRLRVESYENYFKKKETDDPVVEYFMTCWNDQVLADILQKMQSEKGKDA